LWVAFWNTPTCIDTWLLFDEAIYLSQFNWTPFADELLHRWYVNLQPPFLTFWFSRVPVLWFHQLLWVPWAVLCAGLMWKLYGRAAALLLATPVFALMIHQPSHDVLLFGTLLIVLRVCQLSRRGGSRTAPTLAAFVYGLTWMIKPLTILTVPFMLPQLGVAGLLSVGMWGGYLLWSLQWEFGRHQLRFLLHQLLIRSMKNPKGRGNPPLPLPGGESPSILRALAVKLGKLLGFLLHTLEWRWKRLGRNAVKALPFYLCPAWLRPWTWKGIILAVVIIFGYGNIKYLLLDLLFLFPVRES
jgi:hypothetical protein